MQKSASTQARGTSLSLQTLHIANSTLLPMRINEHAELAQAAITEFAEQYHLMLPTFKGAMTMFGYLYPDAPLERLIAAGKYLLVLWYFDDTYGDSYAAQGMLNRKATNAVEALINDCIRAFAGHTLRTAHPAAH